MNRHVVTLALLLLVPALWGFDPFRSSNTNVEEGNAKLGAGKYKEALEYYDKAAKELPDEAGVQYNRGVALHRLGKFDKAREALSKATAAQEQSIKGRGFYNLGNTLYELKKYKEAADAFKTSLRLRSGHTPSKWNLELALRRIQEEEKKKKEQDKNKKDNKDKDKKNDSKKQNDKKDKQDNKGQDNKDKEDPDKQDQKDKQKEQEQQDNKEQERADKDRQRPQPQPKEQDAVLDALERNDKNLQRQRLKGMMGGRRRNLKDW